MEISSVNFIRLYTKQEQLQKMQLYIGPLAGIDPAIPVQRSNQLQLHYRIHLSSFNYKFMYTVHTT